MSALGRDRASGRCRCFVKVKPDLAAVVVPGNTERIGACVERSEDNVAWLDVPVGLIGFGHRQRPGIREAAHQFVAIGFICPMDTPRGRLRRRGHSGRVADTEIVLYLCIHGGGLESTGAVVKFRAVGRPTVSVWETRGTGVLRHDAKKGAPGSYPRHRHPAGTDLTKTVCWFPRARYGRHAHHAHHHR